ncbi:MAG: GTPase, partial [Rickettsiales bacterium]
FPDEDIPEEKLTEIINIIGDLKYRISKLQQNFSKEKAIMQGINISIIGPVNAGKSSLINYLVGKEVSIVSDIAGTTRDLIEVNLDLAGYAVTLIDTAGLREYSNDKIEQIGINKTKEKAANSDFKILLLAADQISEIANYQDYIDANSLVVINKCELNTNSDGAYANITKNSLKISVKKQLNLDLLLKKITTLIAENYNLEDNIAINKERHYNIVNEIYVELAKIDLTNDLVIIAEILRRCTFLLEKIVGLIDVEDILDKIFLSFCIGK